MKRIALLMAAVSVCACSAAPSGSDESTDGEFQGGDSVQVDLDFDAEVRAETAADAAVMIDQQLYWLMGQFHKLGGDPRLSWAKTKTTSRETRTAPRAEGVVTYHAHVPVAWPTSVPVPKTYTVVLPKRMAAADQQAFFESYEQTCLAADAHDVNWSNAWYDFAPSNPNCKLADDDVIRPTATVSAGEGNTVGTYPEYDRMWADKKFSAVITFGRDVPGSTGDDDEAVRWYRDFIKGMRERFSTATVNETLFNDDDAARSPIKETIIDATAGAGRSAHVVVFLVSKASWLSATFAEKRYNPETVDADLVAYHGHAGLGGNVQRLEQFGVFKPNQYQLHVYDGCDTYAYVGESLFKRKREINGIEADPFGTRDLDIVLTAMPTPIFVAGDSSLLKLTKAAIDSVSSTPVASYGDVLGFFPRGAHTVVVGDEDNKYVPRF